MKNIPYLLLLLIGLLGWTSCNDDDGSGNACGSTFDQSAMLASYADDLLVPAYISTAERMLELETAGNVFLAITDQAGLDHLRNTLATAYLHYVLIEPYQFGPAFDLDLRTRVNSFPTDTAKVAAALDGVVLADTDLTFTSGFPALEFALFSQDDAATLARFADLPENAAAREFLSAQINRVVSGVITVNDAWQNGYRSTFVGNTGTAAGSSVSNLVNALNEHWERTKRDRLGIPAGIATLGITNPASLEARYLQSSVAFLLASIDASQQFFQQGLDDYLTAVGAEKNGESLVSLINQQYTAARNAVAELPEPLAETVDNAPAEVTDAYAKLVQNIVLLKTDMPSVLCVAITYVDNPSDSD